MFRKHLSQFVNSHSSYVKFQCYHIRTNKSKSRLMPKDPKHAQQLKEQRLRAQAKHSYKSKVVPSEFSLNILSNGRRGFPGALYIFSGNNRYLFNCGEGTQRLAHEHKAKLAKLQHIFFTHNKWENIGGLPGLTLTVQDIGIPEINLHGPPGIDDIYRMTKGFLITRDINIKSYEDKIFSDNAMTVESVVIKGPSHGKCKNISGDHVQWVDENRAACDFTHQNKKLKTDHDDDIAVAYICKLQPKPGQLNLNLCIEAGVEPGPLLGLLKNGQDIQLAEGKIVRSKDVTNPDELGPLFIVVECPSKEFLDNLESSTDWSKYHEGNITSPDNFPVAVVHFTPSDVVSEPQYQQWMAKFPVSTNHLMLNDSQKDPNSIAIHRIQHQLNLLHPEIFPVLPADDFSKIMLKLYLRPPRGVVHCDSSNVTAQNFIQEVNNEIVNDEIAKFKHNMENLKIDDKDNVDYPQIVFLGTGSSIPSKVRNTSGILVNFSEEKSMIMDIGEGIFGQLISHYGDKEINRILCNIHCIFITHLHADHHLGLIQLLKERFKAFGILNEPYKKVELIAPPGMMKWLSAYDESFENICDLFNMLTNDKLMKDDGCNCAATEQLGIKQIKTVPVKHCWHAYGISITDSNGWTIVYSGDTMPCESLVKAGENCDVLIHEATMEDDLEEDAAYKAHSTMSQAIAVGQQMNARYTILTHFSQRYAKVPLFNDQMQGKVAIAFDNMRVRPKDLAVLPLLHPALKVMFEEHYTEMENKKSKRQKTRQIQQLEMNKQ